MEVDEQMAFIEGVDIDDVIDEEFEDEEGTGQHLRRVEAMNDALEANKFKGFFKTCALESTEGVKPPNLKGFFYKSEGKADALDVALKAVFERDGVELERLIERLQNAVLGMRLKLAHIVDELSAAEVDVAEALSFLNLRVEVLCDYWSYICLFGIMKVSFVQVS
jgi:hypothetical protein